MTFALILLSLFFAPQQTAAPLQAVAPSQSSRSYRISGTVVDSVTGVAIPRVEVTISASSGDGEDETIRATDGTFAFDGVQPGRKYRLFAAAAGYISEGYNQHRGFYSAIAVGDAFDSEHIVFRLHPQAVIYGTVTDERGEPVRHAQMMLVTILRGRGPVIQNTQPTNDLGEYRFYRLPPGKYFVMVQASPWYAQSGFKFAPQPQASDRSVTLDDGNSIFISVGPITPKSDPALDVVYPITYYPSATDPHDAEELQIAAGEKREADIALAAVPSVHVRVTNVPMPATSSPETTVPPNFQVSVSAFGASIMSWGPQYTQIGPGEYELAGLPPGNAALTINEFGPEHRSETLQANLSVGTIDAGAAVSSANVSGQVIFPGGAPASIQGAVFLSNGQQANYSARLHKDGTFAFESSELLPGTYRVSISINNGRGENYVQQVSATGAKVSGRDVTIDAGASVQLNVSIGRGLGQISGVAQIDGKPASGAMALLIPESGQDIEEDYREDQTNTDGSFALGRIIPGKYLLMAIQNGWDLDWRDPQVLAPFRDKAQRIEIAPGQQQKIAIASQVTTPTAAPTSANP